MFFHTISGHILAVFFIPSIICLKLYRRNELNKIKRWFPKDTLSLNISRFIILCQIFSSFNIICTMVNGYIHRRHLMVWAIFAPKVIFDIVHIGTIDLLLIVLCFVLRAIVGGDGEGEETRTKDSEGESLTSSSEKRKRV